MTQGISQRETGEVLLSRFDLLEGTSESARAKTAETFLELLGARVRNPNTRSAYLVAWRSFLAFCSARQLELESVKAYHVGAWLDQHPGSRSTQRQHLAAVRLLFDSLMMRGIVEYNPAARARPPRLVRESSHTAVFEEAEIVAFLDSISLESLKDVRDKASGKKPILRHRTADPREVSKRSIGRQAKHQEEHPGMFPSAVTQNGADGKPQTSIQPVKDGSDIQSNFFDMWRQEHADADLQDVPGDLVTASGSGLDPNITLANAEFQLDRIAAKWADDTKHDAGNVRKEIDQILQNNVTAPFGGLAGEKLVNVLEVNLELCKRYGLPK
jgi:K+-transporting ATPase, c chain/Phage integrase, N-terminal SAM-like domain